MNACNQNRRNVINGESNSMTASNSHIQLTHFLMSSILFPEFISHIYCSTVDTFAADKNLELAVINPGLVMGAPLSPNNCTSADVSLM